MRRFLSVWMLVSGLLVSGGNANAAAVFTIEEVGADIRVTASGTLNTTGLTLGSASAGPGWGVLDPNPAFITVGPPEASGVNYAYYRDPITGPASFGNSSSFLGASSTTNSSSIVGFFPAQGHLYTPVGFVSGSGISGSSTFVGQSYTSLGLTQGQSYTYTLANNETITVQIRSAPPQPIPTLSEWAQIMMMLMMIATAGFFGWRMKQR